MALKSMLELMDDALATMGTGYKSVLNFITDPQRSQSFIDHMMDDNTSNFPSKKSKVYNYTQLRARHIAVTFFMGMIFSEFGGFYSSLPGVLNCGHLNSQQKALLAQRMWLITSLTHDNGYRQKEVLADETLDLRTEYPYFLLTDSYTDPHLQPAANFSVNYRHVLAHTYEEILLYNDYIRKYHNLWKSKDEANDHGIIGGAEKFDDLTDKMIRENPAVLAQELPLIKACCLSVAQHNIFKSPDRESDDRYKDSKLYHLVQDSPFRITADTPLLLFLCLIDTIECTKRFAKGANPKSYVNTGTILTKIKLHVDADQIVIDLSELQRHIEKEHKPLINVFNNYINNSLLSFHTWTVFQTTPVPDHPYRYTITLNR